LHERVDKLLFFLFFLLPTPVLLHYIHLLEIFLLVYDLLLLLNQLLPQNFLFSI
jgi:hypothetical protein